MRTWIGLASLVSVTWVAMPTAQARGEWGRHAVRVSAAPVASPDRSRSLRKSDTGLVVTDSTGGVVAGPIPVETLAEVQWSPNSQAFALTESDGGSVGTWSFRVFSLVSGTLKSPDLTAAVLADFQARPKGCPDEFPNVAVLGWASAQTLVIVAEAPPHSSCRDMGAIRGYEISASDGGIRRRLNARELASTHGGLLGARIEARR